MKMKFESLVNLHYQIKSQNSISFITVGLRIFNMINFLYIPNASIYSLGDSSIKLIYLSSK